MNEMRCVQFFIRTFLAQLKQILLKPRNRLSVTQAVFVRLIAANDAHKIPKTPDRHKGECCLTLVWAR